MRELNATIIRDNVENNSVKQLFAFVDTTNSIIIIIISKINNKNNKLKLTKKSTQLRERGHYFIAERKCVELKNGSPIINVTLIVISKRPNKFSLFIAIRGKVKMTTR